MVVPSRSRAIFYLGLRQPSGTPQVVVNRERVATAEAVIGENARPTSLHDEPRSVARPGFRYRDHDGSWLRVGGSPRDRKYELAFRFVLRSLGVHEGFELAGIPKGSDQLMATGSAVESPIAYSEFAGLHHRYFRLAA